MEASLQNYFEQSNGSVHQEESEFEAHCSQHIDDEEQVFTKNQILFFIALYVHVRWRI